jgi:hypothetical protein
MCYERSSVKRTIENEESHVQMQYSPDPFARVILRM